MHKLATLIIGATLLLGCVSTKKHHPAAQPAPAGPRVTIGGKRYVLVQEAFGVWTFKGPVE